MDDPLPRPDAQQHVAPAGRPGAGELPGRDVPVLPAMPAVHALGRALHALSVYGFEHRGAVRTITDTYELLTSHLDRHGRLNLSVTDDILLIDGERLATEIPLIRLLSRRMAECELTSLSFVRGLPPADFENLLRALMTRGEKGKAVAAVLPASPYLIAERVTFVKVRDGDTVIRQEEAGTPAAATVARIAAQGGASGGRAAGDDASAASEAPAGAGATAAEVVDFIQGAAAAGVAPPEALAELSKDAQRLGELILRAAMARASQAARETGETLEDAVLGCLQRTIDGLLSGPDRGTPRGRGRLRRALLDLERSVLDRVKGEAEAPEPDLARRVRDAVDAAVVGLEAEQLVREARQARERLDRIERRLSRYIDRAIEQGGEEQTRRRMMGVGMAEDEWKDLLAMRRPAPGAPSG